MSAHRWDTAWGAQPVSDGGVRYRLWAPDARTVDLIVPSTPERRLQMERAESGWFTLHDPASCAGTRYLFEIDRSVRVPDPACRFAPDGPHGASEVIDPCAFQWPHTDFTLPPFHELVFYELHIGTFTAEGTFAAAIGKLGFLCDLGVNAIELMPVAQAPGKRNWGYDGVLPYAPAHAYGTPDDLKRLVTAAHERGLAMFLDVVYNHFGPEGNYLHTYARSFFTGRHQTPWGAAIDYSSAGNDPVRRFAIDNACYWLEEYQFDGLRLDATQAIFDDRPAQLLGQLAEEVRSNVGHAAYLVVENDDNQLELLLRSGYDAQWNDDVHHALHTLITQERDGYYADYAQRPIERLGRALASGYAFQGEASWFRGGRLRGAPSAHVPLSHFVNFLQNHDQVGNRAFGERIGRIAEAQALRAALTVLLLAPSPPLLFMGEEWNASTPFLFFCDFEPELAQRVTQGRRQEFERFSRFSDAAMRSRIPDPGSEATFSASVLQWNERDRPPHREWLAFYRGLLALRREAIVPRTKGIRGTDAGFELRGRSGLRVWWRLADGCTLQLHANLGADAFEGFDKAASGLPLFATPADGFTQHTAAPWSARWSVESA